MRPCIGALLCLAAIGSAACGPSGPSEDVTSGAAVERRAVVWLDHDGLDEETALSLAAVGVDELVVRRGSINIASGVPVLRLEPAPQVPGVLPVGVALRLDGAESEPEPEVADSLWRALVAELGQPPAELILDLPRVVPSLPGFVARLAQVARVPVIPMLTPAQLTVEGAVEIAVAAGGVIVPAFGSVGHLRPGAEASIQPLAEQLAPLAVSGVRVRVALVLRPRCEPPLATWGEGIDALCDPETTEISTTSDLDRSFIFRRTTVWSGRTWSSGEEVAIRWMDASRLNSGLAEISGLVLPETGGWDLVFLPPGGPSLGVSREACIAYLGGSGPGPDAVVRADRRGRSLTVTLSNPRPFGSAVSGYGNWVEVSVGVGSLVAEDRGSFDRIILGTHRNGAWQQTLAGGANAVRFHEIFVAPDEEVRTGTVRLPSSLSRVRVRWQVVLSTGEELTGEVVE